jgi:hypothetical protein
MITLALLDAAAANPVAKASTVTWLTFATIW